jgi:hypothetical protein
MPAFRATVPESLTRENGLLSNEKAFVAHFLLEPRDGLTLQAWWGEPLAITNRILCEPDLTNQGSRLGLCFGPAAPESFVCGGTGQSAWPRNSRSVMRARFRFIR